MPVRVVLLVAPVLATALAGGLVVGAPAANAGPHPRAASVVNMTPPVVDGTPQVGARLTAEPGTWQPPEATFSYRWLRDGDPVPGAVERRYVPVPRDVGRQLAVRVTGASGGFVDGVATSESVTITPGTLVAEKPPTIDGSRRYGHTLVARHGSWNQAPDRFRYRWLRNGRPIKGARGPRHALGLADFGERISVEVSAVKDGYRREVVTSGQTVRIAHRVPTRHTVTYHVETRGQIVADLGLFKKQAQQTFDDPRGWRGSGVAFRRVARGGSFTLVLSEASQVPTFSPVCSAQWSCRVGRFVIINQTRWRNASPMWNQVHRSLRDYRHMVVNHETGHWLGWGHRTCPGRGAAAPVMQQQSKGLEGCRANPWPTPAERRVPRFS